MSTPTRRRARPGEGALLREEILRAAEALLAEAGDESVLTLRAVAARTGVTTPAVYRHFADKDALVAAVCMRVWEALGREVRAGIESVDDAFQRLRHGAAAYVRFGLDHPVQYRLLMMGPPRSGSARPEQEAATACLRYLTEAVRPCVDAGVLIGDPQEIALRALTAVHGCVALMIAHPYFPWPRDRDAFADEVARMTGLGTAALGRLLAEPSTSAPPAPAPAPASASPSSVAPSSAAYVAAFARWSDELRARETPTRRDQPRPRGS